MMYLSMLLTQERIRVENLAKAACSAQKAAHAYVIVHMDEDEHDQRMKAEAYQMSRRLVDKWRDADAIHRNACDEYVLLRASAALR